MKNDIPNHVAIIMDGNGRWAKSRGMIRSFGHAEGIKSIERIANYSNKIGIKFLTLYAFSTENWNRSESEIDFLMKIFKEKLNQLISNQRNFKYRLIGKKENISKDIIDLSDTLEEKTKFNDGINLNIAFNYGSKQEIIDASKKIARDYKSGILENLNTLNENKFNSYLYTYDQPNVDLLIRTGSEKRLSNFLLWQSSYAELIFVNTLWPDFSESDFDKCIEEFNSRNRRFGREE